MKRIGIFLLLLSCLEAREVRIEIKADKLTGAVIPRTIFGTFLEPIGNSTYNGLWAEILQNPSLEEDLWSAANTSHLLAEQPELRKASDLALPLPWEPLNAKQGNRYEPRWGDAANSSRSLEILGVPGQPTGIKQRVFLPVHRELLYTGSLYAKHLSGPGILDISLRTRNRPDQVLAQATVEANEPAWTKHKFSLTLQSGQLQPLDPADFVVQVAGNERVLVDQLSLSPADAIDGLDPEMVRLSREMGTPLVRFGGNFTSGYHWRDGIGPIDKRVSMVNIAWGIPEYNQFGTDEFLRYCNLIGAEPQIALNLGSGTPQEAAEWVQYVNQHEGKSGLLWELGNELWGEWNLGYPTLAELPARTADFSKAVRAVDPAARLIATGQDPDHFAEWNAAQLRNTPGTYNFLSTHFVVTTTRAENKDASADTLTSATLALPVELGRKLESMQQQINATSGYKSDHVHLAFTEWLFHPGDRMRKDAVSFANMAGAVAAGGFLNMLLEHADTVPISDMTGIVEFAGMWKKRGRVYATPSYYVFRMYANAPINQLVQVKSDSADYAVHGGITRLPEIDHAPYLDVVAGVNRNRDRITLFCVNRNLTEDTLEAINLAGFTAGASAHIQSLSSPGIYDENDEAKPEAILPVASDVSLKGGQLLYTFRHASVTRIDLQGR